MSVHFGFERFGCSGVLLLYMRFSGVLFASGCRPVFLNVTRDLILVLSLFHVLRAWPAL
jgi:hypothetical protein